MVNVEIKPGYFVKVRPDDVDRYLASHPGAKRAEDADKDADADADADNSPDSPAEATQEPDADKDAEIKAVDAAETEDKAITGPDFRPRRAGR